MIELVAITYKTAEKNCKNRKYKSKRNVKNT